MFFVTAVVAALLPALDFVIEDDQHLIKNILFAITYFVVWLFPIVSSFFIRSQVRLILCSLTVFYLCLHCNSILKDLDIDPPMWLRYLTYFVSEALTWPLAHMLGNDRIVETTWSHDSYKFFFWYLVLLLWIIYGVLGPAFTLTCRLRPEPQSLPSSVPSKC